MMRSFADREYVGWPHPMEFVCRDRALSSRYLETFIDPTREVGMVELFEHQIGCRPRTTSTSAPPLASSDVKHSVTRVSRRNIPARCLPRVDAGRRGKCVCWGVTRHIVLHVKSRWFNNKPGSADAASPSTCMYQHGTAKLRVRVLHISRGAQPRSWGSVSVF